MIDVSPFVKTLKGKPVAVFGLGVSNNAAIAALARAGAQIAAWDDDAAKRTGPHIKNLLKEDLSSYGCLVLAPGVMPDHPIVKRAKDAGIEILCDIEILHRCHHGRRTAGITGTNGKSTTTALIGHILKENGVSAAVGGNIGRAALDLDLPPQDGVIVLELSSYQLDLCPTFAPDIAVLLNITPDHLDHHGSMDNYIIAKSRIFRGEGYAVIATGDEECRDLAAGLKDLGNRTVQTVTGRDPGNPALPGAHNAQNAAAAFAACRLLGVSEHDIIKAIKTFPGLPHRQYPVARIGNVAYINDSKATNADAAARALACYDDIYWIAGGKPKDGGLNGVEPYMDRVLHAFLIGEAMNDFAVWLKSHKVAHSLCGTLDRAVAEAHAMAQKHQSGIVLLSPACASFDQFRNFEHRGEAFTALVNQLKEKAA
jgi:UDP-N-acetylmuramoylalanine--D-glutamate ligase